MARVTVEDCIHKVENRFALVMLAVQRVRQLKRDKDARPMIRSRNKEAVTSLREIAAGKTAYKEDPLSKNPYGR